MYNNIPPKPVAEIRHFDPIRKSGKEIYEYSESLSSKEEKKKFYNSLRATEKIAFDEYEDKILLEEVDRYIAESDDVIKNFETSFRNIVDKTISYIGK